jgi:hypothetical protein
MATFTVVLPSLLLVSNRFPATFGESPLGTVAFVQSDWSCLTRYAWRSFGGIGGGEMVLGVVCAHAASGATNMVEALAESAAKIAIP